MASGPCAEAVRHMSPAKLCMCEYPCGSASCVCMEEANRTRIGWRSLLLEGYSGEVFCTRETSHTAYNIYTHYATPTRPPPPSSQELAGWRRRRCRRRRWRWWALALLLWLLLFLQLLFLLLLQLFLFLLLPELLPFLSLGRDQVGHPRLDARLEFGHCTRGTSRGQVRIAVREAGAAITGGPRWRAAPATTSPARGNPNFSVPLRP